MLSLNSTILIPKVKIQQTICLMWIIHSLVSYFFIVSSTEKHCQVLFNLGFTIAYELSFNCGELLFEAGKILVKRPHKCLVCPERRLIFRTLSGTVRRA